MQFVKQDSSSILLLQNATQKGDMNPDAKQNTAAKILKNNSDVSVHCAKMESNSGCAQCIGRDGHGQTTAGRSQP